MKIQIRTAEGGKEKVTLSGYVNAVERFSRRLPPIQSNGKTDRPFVEKIQAGAFADAIARNKNIRIMYNHSENIGSQAEGNLSVKEDAIGLYAEAETDNPAVVRAAKNGDLQGWSFGFRDEVDEWNAERSKRTLKSFYLDEISILDITPAYIGTSVQIRSEETVSLRYTADEVEETVEDKGEETTEETVEETTQPEERADMSSVYNAIIDVLEYAI